MKKLLKFVAVALVVVVVLVVGAAVAVPMLLDAEDVKAKVASAVKDQTGRELRIPGAVDVSVFPWLGVRLAGIELGNAEGFPSPVFASTGDVDVRVKLMPLLERKVEMSTITVHDLVLNLEKNEAGRGNWEDLTAAGKQGEAGTSAPGTAPADGLAALAIGGLDVQNATLSYTDASSGQAFKVGNLAFRTGALSPGRPVDVELGFDLSSSNPPMSGRVNGRANVDVNADARSATVKGFVLEADMKGDTLPGGAAKASLGADAVIDGASNVVTVTNLALSALDLKATGDLTATGIDADPKIAGNLTVAEFNPRTLLGSLGAGELETTDGQALTRASLKAALTGSASALTLKPLEIRLDDTMLSGHLGVADLAAQAIRFDLALDQIDLDRYLPPPGASSGAAPAASPGAASAGATTLPLEMLRALDVEGALKAGRVKVANLSLSDLAATVMASNGVIRLAPLSARLYDGSYAGNITLDARDATPRLAVDESIQKVSIGPLLKDLQGEEPITGTANLKAKLTAQGAGLEPIKRSLSGDVSFQFLDGALQGVNIGKMIRDAKAKLKGAAAAPSDEPNKTDFAEITGSARIDDGTLSNQDLSGKSPLIRITGKGTAELPTERIDYRATATLVATSKGQGGKELADLHGVPIPVHITGTFSEPKYGLDMEALAQSLATSKARELVDAQKEKVQQKVQEKVQEKVGEALGDKAGQLLGGDDKGGSVLKKLLGN